MTIGLAKLSAQQCALLEEWMPRLRIVADLSWGLVDTVVFEARDDDRRVIVKAGGPENHHLLREIDAHEQYTGVWRARDAAASLIHVNRDARILVLSYLPGTLAYRTAAGLNPEVHRQAGELLRVFHEQESRSGGREDEQRQTARAIAWLDGEHRIAADIEARLREELAACDPGDPPLVPTHGDWQPRNWLVDGGRVRIIDFGRFAFRSAASDLVRLAAQEWRENPDCERAFLEGYGSDPRTPGLWRLIRIREAIGTAAWAYQVGDEAFELQGHRMIAEVLG